MLYDLFKPVVTKSPTGDGLRCITPPLSLHFFLHFSHTEKGVSMTSHRVLKMEREKGRELLLSHRDEEREKETE